MMLQLHRVHLVGSTVGLMAVVPATRLSALTRSP